MLTLKAKVDRLKAEVGARAGSGAADSAIIGKTSLKDQFNALCAHPSIAGIVEAVGSPGSIDVEDIRSQLDSAKVENQKLSTRITELEGQVANSSRADARAREMLAAKGINTGIIKDAPRNLQNGGLVGLWERYQEASTTEKVKMREQYGEQLDEAAKAYDRDRAR